MKPSRFVYHRPRTVEETLRLLAELAPEDGRIIAGGQSLVPMMAFRLARPSHLIDINEVEGLDRLGLREGWLTIGARIRHAAFHRPVTGGPLGALLATVVRHIAHYPIRTRGTLCGSLANADPASEWCLVAATLGAEMVARSDAGTRTIAAADFFSSALCTNLEEHELLAEARLPALAPDTRFGFEEFSRRKGDYAMAASLATFRVVEGRIVAPHLGIGGAEERPRRLAEAEAMLVGEAPSETLLRHVADEAARQCHPIVDQQVSQEYRRDLVRAVTRRALGQAAGLSAVH